MPTIDRARDRGHRNARRLLSDLGSELREARLAAGLSQRFVARAAGLSQSRISRTERAALVPVRIDELATHCAALGLRLSTKTYPDGLPVRDEAQQGLLHRLHKRTHAAYSRRTESLVGTCGDLRA